MIKVTLFRSYQDWFKHIFIELGAKTNRESHIWIVAKRGGNLVGKWDYINQRGWSI